ncbi:tRNA pseudouridine synthase B [bacterium]|nr:tRNA pseudouridine synthase B [bacterium]
MLIAVDKPLELTSFDIVKRLKHVFPGEKIGHSGTLDPKATGLMILGIGKGTKKLNELIGLDKSYQTVIDFSKKSDTRDAGYWEYFEDLLPVREKEQKKPTPTLTEIETKLSSLIPAHELPLPAFSAKKKEGKRLYQLARKGKTVTETKIMNIQKFEILEYQFPLLKLSLDVGSGTYIRSIAHRLGEELGIGGILVELRRTRIGKRDVKTLFEDQSRGTEIQVVDYHMRGQVGSFKWRMIEE